MYGLSSRESLSKKNIRLMQHPNNISKTIRNADPVIEDSIDEKYSKLTELTNNILQQQIKLNGEVETINKKLTDLLKHLTKNSPKSNEFIPFYFKEEFTCRDNKTELTNNYICMTVELLGNMGNIIYPFGSRTNVPNFVEQDIPMRYRDNEMFDNDNICGRLTKRDDVYIIEINDVYLDNAKIKFDDLKFPVTIWCDTYLN
jgi:hypothetical protein